MPRMGACAAYWPKRTSEDLVSQIEILYNIIQMTTSYKCGIYTPIGPSFYHFGSQGQIYAIATFQLLQLELRASF